MSEPLNPIRISGDSRPTVYISIGPDGSVLHRTVHNPSPRNSSSFSQFLPENPIIPYFNDPKYITEGCKLLLNEDGHHEITIELAGLLSSDPVLYPFGHTPLSQLPKMSIVEDQIVSLVIVLDSDPLNLRQAHGLCHVQDGVLTILIQKCLHDNSEIPFFDLDLPLTLSFTL